ncbi:peroxisome biogenesis protein 22 isoform X4 [Elaeis guineensis]|uniref:Peroxisome biogenesis protein 22 isoform X8 n=1 Tax=Elaeis guineensis var. tenera TaxID=51953 RepID=A0A6I9RSX1_ELAGV|nr:peroxisome biogenesis protein 22 isoform X8 [Elaeis guineensis]
MAESVSSAAKTAKEEELADLIQRFMASLAELSERLPFTVDRQKLRSITTLAAFAIALVFAWKLLRAPTDQQRRQRRRHGSNGLPNARAPVPSSELCSSSADSRVQDVVDEFFQPVKLTLEQVVRHKLSEGRKVTCRLLGVILEETTPEELQGHATVKSSVLEVLLEITKFCDVYLMERILDDESGGCFQMGLGQAIPIPKLKINGDVYAQALKRIRFEVSLARPSWPAGKMGEGVQTAREMERE